MELIAKGLDGHLRGKLLLLNLLQIIMGVIPHLKDREAIVLCQVFDVIVMGWLIGRLPGRCLDSVEDACDQVGSDDEHYEVMSDQEISDQVP